MDVLTYSPGQVVVSICGYIVDGWSNISVAFNSPVFRQVRGIRGKNTRIRNKDTSATVRISLIQSSVANDVLTNLLSEDRNSGASRLDITIKDNSGTGLFASSTAYIEGFPEMGYSASQSERVWTVLCDASSNVTVGGNAEQGVDFASMAGAVISKIF